MLSPVVSTPTTSAEKSGKRVAPVDRWQPAPAVSVVIVNYNGRQHLGRCLSSLATHTDQGYEVILVDNASSDGSADYVERAFPTVQVIQTEANLGFGRGSNLGAASAQGKYLAFLNPDTVVEPGWLGALIDALEADPEAGLATPKILLLDDGDRINTCGNQMHYTGLTLPRGMGMDRAAFPDSEEAPAVSGAAFVIRRDLFEALGGFDKTFFLYMEDTDLSWRARLAGYKCLYVSGSVVYHDYSLRFGPKKTFYQERNRYLMLLKGLRWPTLIALSPALLLSEVVTWGFVLLRERRNLTNKLRAYAWVAKHWGDIMRSRQRTQALRSVRDHDLIAQNTHHVAYEQTGDGIVPRVAHLIFDPLFYALHRMALALVRW